jgi:acetolactate synthase regulatory subunit
LLRNHLVALILLSVPSAAYIWWYTYYSLNLFQREPWRIVLFLALGTYSLLILRILETPDTESGSNWSKEKDAIMNFSQKAFVAFAVYFVMNNILLQDRVSTILLVSNLPFLQVLSIRIVWYITTGLLVTFGSVSLLLIFLERRLIQTAKKAFNWLRVPVALLLCAFSWGIWYATPLSMISLRFVEVTAAYLGTRYVSRKTRQNPQALDRVLCTINDEGVKVLALSASMGAVSIAAFNMMITSNPILQTSKLQVAPLVTSLLTAATNYIGVLFMIVTLVFVKIWKDLVSEEFARTLELGIVGLFLLAVITFLDALAQTIGPLRLVMDYLWSI